MNLTILKAALDGIDCITIDLWDADLEDWKAAVAEAQRVRPDLTIKYTTSPVPERRCLPVLSLGGFARQCSTGLPRAIDYPEFEGMQGFLGRECRLVTLAEAKAFDRPMFVKPAHLHKAFEGRVMTPSLELCKCAPAGLDHVWVCDRVRFFAEYRAFIVGDRVLAQARYSLDEDAPERPPKPYNPSVADAFAVAYAATGEAPAAFVADFGVTVEGETLLVEVGDGFCFGTYGIKGPALAVAAYRWKEIWDS